jgi:hypothetical protein
MGVHVKAKLSDFVGGGGGGVAKCKWAGAVRARARHESCAETKHPESLRHISPN